MVLIIGEQAYLQESLTVNHKVMFSYQFDNFLLTKTNTYYNLLQQMLAITLPRYRFDCRLMW